RPRRWRRRRHRRSRRPTPRPRCRPRPGSRPRRRRRNRPPRRGRRRRRRGRRRRRLGRTRGARARGPPDPGAASSQPTAGDFTGVDVPTDSPSPPPVSDIVALDRGGTVRPLLWAAILVQLLAAWLAVESRALAPLAATTRR